MLNGPKIKVTALLPPRPVSNCDTAPPGVRWKMRPQLKSEKR